VTFRRRPRRRARRLLRQGERHLPRRGHRAAAQEGRRSLRRRRGDRTDPTTRLRALAGAENGIVVVLDDVSAALSPPLPPRCARGVPSTTPRPCTRDRTPHPASQGRPLRRARTCPGSRVAPSTVHTRPNPLPCVAGLPVASRPHLPALPRRPLDRAHAIEPRTLRGRVARCVAPAPARAPACDPSTVHTRPNPAPCVAGSPVASRPHPPGLPRRRVDGAHATEPRTLRRRVGA
jgi:hypothetical protein